MSNSRHNLRITLKQFRRRITYSNLFVNAIANLGFSLIWLLSKTFRTTIEFDPQFAKLASPKVLYAFWHGRQLLLIPTFSSWGIATMNDVSWAGDIQTRILQKFGYGAVRGSSTRQGVRALLEMKKAMDRGWSGAFAVDGPRGPAFQTKPGIVFLAKKMRLPIVPVTASASKAWILGNTWCRYLLPKPFSRCTVFLGRPLPPTGDYDLLTAENIDRSLDALTFAADQKMAVEFHRRAKAAAMESCLDTSG